MDSALLQVEQLEISYSQGMMLLPITVQHTINERSPLWGHSHDSLLVRFLKFQSTTDDGGGPQVHIRAGMQCFWRSREGAALPPATCRTSCFLINSACFQPAEPPTPEKPHT